MNWRVVMAHIGALNGCVAPAGAWVLAGRLKEIGRETFIFYRNGCYDNCSSWNSSNMVLWYFKNLQTTRGFVRKNT